MFTNLRVARVGFIFGHCYAFILLILWGNSVLHGCCNRRYGYYNLNRLYIVLAPICYLLGLLYWFDRSEARFDNDCEDEKDNDFEVPKICPTVGPSLGIFTYILMQTVAVVYVVISMKFELRDQDSIAEYPAPVFSPAHQSPDGPEEKLPQEMHNFN